MRLKMNAHIFFAIAAVVFAPTMSAAEPSRSPRTQWTDGVLWNSGDYRYDAAGHIIGIGEDRYVYDGANRVVSATAMTPGNAKNKQVFDYDRYGNLQVLTTETNNDGTFGIEFAVTPSSNRLDGDCVRGLPCVLAAYDGAGNQTGMVAGDGRYTWDAAGMMTELNLPGRNERYVYDANDERVVVRSMSGGETRRYTLRGSDNKLAREVTRTGDTWTWSRDYVYRDGLLLASFVGDEQGDGPHRHYHLDHLGTPRVTTDGRRYKLARSTYWPFGQEAPGSASVPGERLKFTGHERDANPSGPGWDLDYMHARYYSAGWGRFLSVDPAWSSTDLGQPQTWNRYAYARNSPVNRLDPDGRSSLAIPPVIVGLGAAAYVCASNPQCSQRAISFAVGTVHTIQSLSSAMDEAADGTLDASDLPSDPDELLDRGYDETSHPDAAAAGHRSFENSDTGDKLRFDKGKDGKPGHEGRDHYHRENPNSTGKQDQYLDVDGNPVPRGSDASHLYPKSVWEKVKSVFQPK